MQRKASVSVLLILILASAALQACSGAGSRVAFTIPEPDLIPEGIAYDPQDRAFYVSSTYKRKIVRVAGDGAVSDFTQPGQDGLWGTVGMRVDPARRLLWVASSHAGEGMPMVGMDLAQQGSAGVFKYDLTTGRLVRKYLLDGRPQPHFLNDLTLDDAGNVFVTDSAERSIYRISTESDALELFLQPPEMASPNGITLSDDGRFLFVALRGQVGRVERSSGAFTLLTLPDGVEAKADGLYAYGDSLIAIWPGAAGAEVARYRLNASRDAIDSVQVLDGGHPALAQPTTGVIVGDDLYYVANSQLQVFKRIYAQDAGAAADELRDPVILRLALTP